MARSKMLARFEPLRRQGGIVAFGLLSDLLIVEGDASQKPSVWVRSRQGSPVPEAPTFRICCVDGSGHRHPNTKGLVTNPKRLAREGHGHFRLALSFPILWLQLARVQSPSSHKPY
ncbi:hypothetical protein CLAIMM_08827 [Cladophialophora immunda]|nr:hypothetical protein CLAIMM_08827 [Cladophialophora immunda]